MFVSDDFKTFTVNSDVNAKIATNFSGEVYDGYQVDANVEPMLFKGDLSIKSYEDVYIADISGIMIMSDATFSGAMGPLGIDFDSGNFDDEGRMLVSGNALVVKAKGYAKFSVEDGKLGIKINKGGVIAKAMYGISESYSDGSIKDQGLSKDERKSSGLVTKSDDNKTMYYDISAVLSEASGIDISIGDSKNSDKPLEILNDGRTIVISSGISLIGSGD